MLFGEIPISKVSVSVGLISNPVPCTYVTYAEI